MSSYWKKKKIQLMGVKDPNFASDIFGRLIKSIIQVSNGCQMESMKEEVEEVLETLRPMLMQDGGNVELVDIDDGVVKLRLVGACSSCSSSTMTLKMGIEKALKKAIPMVRCVEAIEQCSLKLKYLFILTLAYLSSYK